MLRERSFLKKIVASDKTHDAMEVISDPWSKLFEVEGGRSKLFFNMYGGTGNNILITKKFVLRMCTFHEYQVN